MGGVLMNFIIVNDSLKGDHYDLWYPNIQNNILDSLYEYFGSFSILEHPRISTLFGHGVVMVVRNNTEDTSCPNEFANSFITGCNTHGIVALVKKNTGGELTGFDFEHIDCGVKMKIEHYYLFLIRKNLMIGQSRGNTYAIN